MKGGVPFSSLPVGASFDFIPYARSSTFFFYRCVKVSARCYTWTDKDGRVMRSRVGSKFASVYHVKSAAPAVRS